jgi:hypothetical protein
MIDRYIEWVYTLSGAERLMYSLGGIAALIIIPFMIIAVAAVVTVAVQMVKERREGE